MAAPAGPVDSSRLCTAEQLQQQQEQDARGSHKLLMGHSCCCAACCCCCCCFCWRLTASRDLKRGGVHCSAGADFAACCNNTQQVSDQGVLAATAVCHSPAAIVLQHHTDNHQQPPRNCQDSGGQIIHYRGCAVQCIGGSKTRLSAAAPSCPWFCEFPFLTNSSSPPSAGTRNCAELTQQPSPWPVAGPAG